MLANRGGKFLALFGDDISLTEGNDLLTDVHAIPLLEVEQHILTQQIC